MMDILKVLSFLVLCMAFSVKGEISIEPLIQPEINDKVENSSVSFKCMLKSSAFSIISWMRKNLGYTCIYNQKCDMLSSNPENVRYSCKCQKTEADGIIVELQIYNITREDHESTWICEVTSSSTSLKKKAFLFVKVPIKKIEIMPSRKIVQISENSSYQFSCTSSIGRPVPKIIWVVAKENNHGYSLTFKGNQSDHNDTTESEMSYANSTFLYSPNRTVNGWKIFCSVEETEIQTKVQSDPIQLNITYPPESSLMINGLFNEGTYKVIENSTGLINCTIIGGNPAPIVSWTTCFETAESNVKYTNTSMEIYSDVFKWKAKPDTDMKCKCDCTQMEKNQSLSINVEIIYPPRLPTISSRSEVITGEISVLIDTFLTFNCTSDSKPSSKYEWRFNNGYLSDGQQYDKQSQKADQGIYTCVATNSIEPTNGMGRFVSSNTSFELHILYPPTIGNIVDQTVVEGDALNFSCPVISGNPDNTQIKWTTSIDIGEKWLTQFLVISNVSRKHDMVYICTVNNTMMPTFEPVEIGWNNNSFHLTVEYRATIKAFYVDGYQQKTNITVDEREILLFRCQVESKPDSTTSIYDQAGNTLDISKTNDISYSISSVTCQQTGAYFCSGRNKHNAEQVSKKTLFIFINCSPRTNPNYPVKKTITVSLNEPVSLNFTALAYPTPTNVTWQKHNGHVWVDVIMTNTINTHQSGLNFNLTFDRILEENFGMYRLIIANEIGSYKQLFFINAAGDESEDSKVMGIVIGSVSGLIAIVLASALLVWIVKKRRTKNGPKEIAKSLNVSVVRQPALEMENLQEIDDTPVRTHEHTEYYNSIQKIEKIDKIKVSELYQYVIGRDEDDFAIEYQNIPTYLQKPYNFATKPENIALNRYNGIFPYDHSRVKIPAIPDFFMNACYINGFERKNAYIASLGPTEKATNHFITFWQMVWFEKSDVIVMLTNLVEPSGMKCEQYWPEPEQKAIYGDICVNSVRLETFAEYTVREFEISKKQEKRCVIQLHFTAWPDKTVPEDVTSLIEFRQRVIQTPTNSSGPVIVHCSAGIGRTGTFIALDRLIREGQKTNEINVFECVQNMRQQRVKMVQTLEQYVYIYKALVTALTFDSEAIPLSSLYEYTEGTSNNAYSRFFQQLNQTVEAEKENEQKAVRRNENQTRKNRPGADIPGNMFRVYLRLRRKQNDSDYINAVFINSFTKPNNFIMAQSPLPLTVEDFVSMIYQDDCICVVSLDERNELGMSVGQYVPEGKQKLTFGSFRVSSSLLQTERYFVLKKLTISYDDKPKSGAKVVYHYQYTQWLEEKRIPECTGDFVHFVSEVQRKAREHGRKKFHILVHCLMANERSGLFCALAIIFEKLKLEGQVSMMNTLRHLRTRRRTAILSMEQLRFCFEAASIFAGLESNK